MQSVCTQAQSQSRMMDRSDMDGRLSLPHLVCDRSPVLDMHGGDRGVDGDTAVLTAEQEATRDRLDKAQDRLIKDFGYGATDGALAISQAYLPRLTEALETALETSLDLNSNNLDNKIARVLKELSPDLLALATLQTVLHHIACEAPIRTHLMSLGNAVNAEVWAKEFHAFAKEKAYVIEDKVRKTHTNAHYRRQAARSLARHIGFSKRGFSNTDKAQVGQWLLNVLLETLHDVFVFDHGVLTLVPEAVQVAQAAYVSLLRRHPVFLPSVTPPLAWTDWSKGGPTDPRMQSSVTLLRSHFRETSGLVRAAIADGSMQPTLDALNSIQSVPWAINKPVLAVLEECLSRGIEVPGLPPANDIGVPDRPQDWDNISEDAQRAWKAQASKVLKANRGLVAARVQMTEDLETAKVLAEHDRFWTPCNCDWRGRVYALPHFNFQRDDRVRGLFLFADGVPIGEEGLWWLKVHVANCGDFEKVSKKSFEERGRWTEENLKLIAEIANDPLGTAALNVWPVADKPFLFLAACMELEAVLASGPGAVTHLPVSWDGTCSGLQHLCAMTRAPEGALVNLTPSDRPQDVYQTVADKVNLRLQEEAANGHELAKVCLAHGITRKEVKRNVMTFAYSSKKYGMAEQQREDLMEPLAYQVLLGKLSDHPFGEDDGYKASMYLAGLVYDGIKETVERPAEAMGFLQSIARALAHEGKVARWTTPVGLPWVNRYHPALTTRLNLWMHDRGVKRRHQVTIAVGEQREVDKTKAANGIAPNFVHACDAAHLMLCVNSAVREGITNMALVHDSFGCLAPQSKRFHQIIREQFIRMYEENDVLTQVLERAKCDLTEHNVQRLPDVVEPGNLNLREIESARYTFA